MTDHEKQVLVTQATSRAWRTLVQNLTFDVAAAVVLVLYVGFVSAESWGDVQWSLLLFTVVKTVVVTGLSYLMKRVFHNFPDAG